MSRRISRSVSQKTAVAGTTIKQAAGMALYLARVPLVDEHGSVSSLGVAVAMIKVSVQPHLLMPQQGLKLHLRYISA